MAQTLTAYIEFDPDTSLYVGIVPGLSDAHTQAASLDELQQLKEVVALCLEEQPDALADTPRSIGLQQFGVV